MIKKLICLLITILLPVSFAGAENLTLHTISCFATVSLFGVFIKFALPSNHIQ